MNGARAEAFLLASPSAKIDMALADLEVAERSPGYAIDMETWHTPERSSNRCLVCFAGAVMASRHGIQPHQVYVGPLPADGPGEFALSARWDDIFTALDQFRCGFVAAYLAREGTMPAEQIDAFARAQSPRDPSGRFPGHVEYADDAEAFRRWAQSMADRMRTAGY